LQLEVAHVAPVVCMRPTPGFNSVNLSVSDLINISSVFTADTLRYAVTLSSDLLILIVCSASSVTLSNSITNF